MANKPRIDSIQIRQEVDESPDLSYLGEYGNNDRIGAIDRKEENGSLDSREYRYWYPSSNHYPHNSKSWTHVSPGEKARVRAEYGSLAKADHAYMLEDYRRMEAFTHGDWVMVGIWAEAQVSYPISYGDSRRLETLRSRGLWGIASDLDAAYVEEVTHAELANLREHLETFGVDVSDFDDLAQKAIEEGSR